MDNLEIIVGALMISAFLLYTLTGSEQNRAIASFLISVFAGTYCIYNELEIMGISLVLLGVSSEFILAGIKKSYTLSSNYKKEMRLFGLAIVSIVLLLSYKFEYTASGLKEVGYILKKATSGVIIILLFMVIRIQEDKKW